MKPKLPREMLWTEKQTMDDFFELEPLNEKFFNVFVTLREDPFDIRSDEVKVFNEVYYQITRMFYENPMPEDLQNYVSDIKANLGWSYSAELVISMAYFMITNCKNKPLNMFFTNSIIDNFQDSIYWKPFDLCSDELKKAGESINYDFNPCPAPIDELTFKYIPWADLTHNYDKNALLELIKLWSKEEEKKELAKLLAASLDFKPSDYRDKYYNLIYRTFKKAFYDKDTSYDIFCKNLRSLTTEESSYKKEIAALQQHIEELEADNNRLRTLLENKKSKGKDRRFTLIQIVEYCKGCVEWNDVKSIVAMLNKLLRRSATKEDSDLVDSIEDEFKSRKYGDTVMGDKNEFSGNSAHNTIELPPGMTAQEAMKLLQNKTNDDGEEG